MAEPAVGRHLLVASADGQGDLHRSLRLATVDWDEQESICFAPSGPPQEFGGRQANLAAFRWPWVRRQPGEYPEATITRFACGACRPLEIAAQSTILKGLAAAGRQKTSREDHGSLLFAGKIRKGLPGELEEGTGNDQTGSKG